MAPHGNARHRAGWVALKTGDDFQAAAAQVDHHELVRACEALVAKPPARRQERADGFLLRRQDQQRQRLGKVVTELVHIAGAAEDMRADQEDPIRTQGLGHSQEPPDPVQVVLDILGLHSPVILVQTFPEIAKFAPALEDLHSVGRVAAFDDQEADSPGADLDDGQAIELAHDAPSSDTGPRREWAFGLHRRSRRLIRIVSRKQMPFPDRGLQSYHPAPCIQNKILFAKRGDLKPSVAATGRGRARSARSGPTPDPPRIGRRVDPIPSPAILRHGDRPGHLLRHQARRRRLSPLDRREPDGRRHAAEHSRTP